jgi:hypothetical protein
VLEVQYSKYQYNLVCVTLLEMGREVQLKQIRINLQLPSCINAPHSQQCLSGPFVWKFETVTVSLVDTAVDLITHRNKLSLLLPVQANLDCKLVR